MAGMSTLFDRLCELAVADHVTAVLAVDTRTRRDPEGAADLVSVLQRSAEVPQLDVWVIPDDDVEPSGVPALQFDLVDMSSVEAAKQIASVVAAVESGAYRSVLVRYGMAVASSDVWPSALVREPGAPATSLRMLAVDRPGWSEHLDRSAATGLTVSVATDEPSAMFRMSDLTAVLSALDTLVVLRAYAFAGRHLSSIGTG